MKKKADNMMVSIKNWLTLMCFIITLFLIIICLILRNYEYKNTFILEMIASGFFGILIFLLIELVIKKVSQKNNISCEYLNMSCKYQSHLNKTGIELVYDKRKGTEKDGYYYDLLDEFNTLNKGHNSSDNPIKIIGVALEAFFNDNPENTDNLPGVITRLCLSAYFQVMFCTSVNRELKTRLDFVNKKCKTEIKLDNTPVINQIKTTKSIIKKLQGNKGNNNEHLKYTQYGFSPYATIIIINEHIYYTPNMLDYLSYLPIGEKKRNEYGEYNNAELSLRIKKDSEYGKRLVDLFDSLWQNANFQPINKKLTTITHE